MDGRSGRPWRLSDRAWRNTSIWGACLVLCVLLVRLCTIGRCGVLLTPLEFGQRCCPFLNLLNGIDRISEDKISAAMLRKFVNTVYDIMRDVKIPSCCRGFLLWMLRILVEYKFYHQMIHTGFLVSFRNYDLVFRKVAKNLSCSRWWKSGDLSCNSIWYWSILSQML